MKRSRIVVVCLISLLLAACGGSAPQNAPSDVATAGTVLRMAKKGSEVEIHLDNVVDLYGLHVHVEFDPDKIQVRDADPDQEGIQIAPGHLPSPDFVALNMVDNEYGMIDYAVVQTNPRQPASGSGVVAVIHTQQDSAEVSPFTVLHIQLAGPDGNELPVQVARGG